MQRKILTHDQDLLGVSVHLMRNADLEALESIAEKDWK